MKIYLFTLDGIHVTSAQFDPIYKFVEGKETQTLIDGCFEYESDDETCLDIMKNLLHYKIVLGTPEKMSDEEYRELYPEPEPSELEKIKMQQEVTDQAVQDLILMMMGGGE